MHSTAWESCYRTCASGWMKKWHESQTNRLVLHVHVSTSKPIWKQITFNTLIHWKPLWLNTWCINCIMKYNSSSLIHIPQLVQWLPSFSAQVSQRACPTPLSSKRDHNYCINPFTQKDTCTLWKIITTCKTTCKTSSLFKKSICFHFILVEERKYLIQME